MFLRRSSKPAARCRASCHGCSSNGGCSVAARHGRALAQHIGARTISLIDLQLIVYPRQNVELAVAVEVGQCEVAGESGKGYAEDWREISSTVVQKGTRERAGVIVVGIDHIHLAVIVYVSESEAVGVR